jgi:hypothetical protein
MDCFVAEPVIGAHSRDPLTPRNDVKSTYDFAIPRRDAPEFCLDVPPSPIRGRRECRAPDAPDSRVCNDSDRTHTR